MVEHANDLMEKNLMVGDAQSVADKGYFLGSQLDYDTALALMDPEPPHGLLFRAAPLCPQSS